jgi:hypothetical protein
MKARTIATLFAVALVSAAVPRAEAAVVWFANTAYLSQANIPVGFYASGSPTFLEDFEDGTLDGGITANRGQIVAQPGVPNPDSVDGDDGSINGSGLLGRSWFVSGNGSPPSVRFDLPDLPTAAALVWTDGASGMTFDVFGPGNVLLVSFTPLVNFANASWNGETAEDRFFGVTDPGGILAIRMTGPAQIVAGLEVDHVQYGSMVPEPATFALFSAFAGFGLFARWRRRRSR